MSSSFDSLFAALAVPQLEDKLFEPIVHYPAGVLADTEDTTASVGDDAFAHLQGDRIADNSGRRQQSSMPIVLPSSVSVTFGPLAVNSSQFVIRGQTWYAVRLLGKDPNLQEVLVTRIDKMTTRETRE